MTKVKPTKENAKDGFRHLKNGSIHKKKQQKFKNTPTGKVALIDGAHQKSNGKLKHQNGNEKHQNSPSQNKSPKGSNKHSNSFKDLKKSPKIKVEEEQDDDDSSVDDINEGISIKEEISAPEDEVDDDSSSSETEAVPDIFGTSLAEETDEDDDEFDADSDDVEEDAAENKGVKMFKGLQPKVVSKESTDDDEEDDDDEDDDDDEEDDDDDDSSDEDVETKPGIKVLLGDTIDDESDDESFKGGEDSEEDEDSDEEIDQSVVSSNAASTDEDDDQENDDDEESSDDDEETPGLAALLGNSIAEDSDDEDFEGKDTDEDDEDEDMNDDDEDDDLVSSPNKKVKVAKAQEEDDDDDDGDGQNESFDSTNQKSDTDDSGKPPRMTAEEKEERNLRTIFIGNVPKETPTRRIKSIFKKFGAIDSIRIRGIIPENPKMPLKVAAIKKKYHSKSTTVCVFVTFKSVESAEKALTMNGKKLDGNFLRVDLATQSRTRDNKRTVFLGNLPFAIEDNEIWEAFKDCGQIESVRIIRDRKSGVGRGFGYINFETADGAVLAMNMNGTTIQNRELRVKVSTPEGKKKLRAEKKGKKRQLAENAISGSPKKPKTDISETAQVAKHNSVNAERRTDKKKRSQGEKQRVKSDSTSPQGKGAGKFQGQKADNKKKSKLNKHAKKKMQMAAKLLAKPKKPSAN